MEPKVAELLKMKAMTSKSKLAVVVEDLASSGMYDKYIKREVPTAIADNIVQTGDSVVDDIVHNPTNIETDVIDPAIKGITGVPDNRTCSLMKDRKVDTLKKHQKQKKWVLLLKNENFSLKISGRIPNGDRNLLSKGISLKSLFGPVKDIFLSRTKR